MQKKKKEKKKDQIQNIHLAQPSLPLCDYEDLTGKNTN
jgi:hypothetical protein